MKDFFAVLLLALSANLDSLVIGMYYGVKNTRILLSTNLLIAFIVGTGSLLSLLFGKLVAQFVSPSIAHCGGDGLIIAAGLWIIRQEAKKRRRVEVVSGFEESSPQDLSAFKGFFHTLGTILETPAYADQDNSGDINYKEGVLLGFALALNNLIICLGLGVSGLEPFLVAGLNAFLSLLLLSLGIKLGCLWFSEGLKRYAGEITGFLLVLTGLYEWLAY